MTIETLDIDRLVREVVRRLTEANQGDATRMTPTVAPAPPMTTFAPSNSISPPSSSSNLNSPAMVGSADVWHLAARLLTVATLDARPAGTRTVVAPRGAVVTPAARDRLRQLRIELQFTDHAAPTPAATRGKLYVHAAAGAGLPNSLTRLLQGLPWTVESLVAAPLPQAVAELAAVLGDVGHLAVLLTSDRDLALCLANRRANVRAVAALDKSAIDAAVRDWGANLLVLDPRRTSPPTMRGWVESFVRGGPRGCPPEWKSWLER